MIEGSKKIKSLNELLKTIDQYDTKFAIKNACKNVLPGDSGNFFMDCVFFRYPFDGIVTTLATTVYKNLSDSVAAEYKNYLESKLKTKTMTTFEYFSYFALDAKMDPFKRITKFLDQ
jgi:hypothetical protein